ncbi:hypothetical protein CPK_ORF00752 [Chlamydia pneumoniae LPCoLN]|uniref:Uncharacterized protein n=1 Tax=Chlamydia pneumoniae TaxID=83558 RepID=A0A0F7WP30_CHLPN|nr:hypothetical protein CPK_ORF00752 [Chlamydia pneumoniae LPCoLN]CRI32741.1 Uncharacterized protein BN1224_Wien1_A_02480 [Chlamydia pneumoniae]CRI35604.1 Uncharacterized protein BN1224_CM1_A_02510 [Chlamydia pneumoniae]CRI36731.1 Uncharacterized protein BN1224_CV14_A_02500 [Chlamydia pneumoniae]CRI37854.1 Uncharacterized protein BN1224_CV15_B_01770 [Chlamydia pneumoniae]
MADINFTRKIYHASLFKNSHFLFNARKKSFLGLFKKTSLSNEASSFP